MSDAPTGHHGCCVYVDFQNNAGPVMSVQLAYEGNSSDQRHQIVLKLFQYNCICCVLAGSITAVHSV